MRQTSDIAELDRLLADTPRARAALTVLGAQLRAEGVRRAEARQATIDPVGQGAGCEPEAPAVTPNMARPKRQTSDIADLDRMLAGTPQARAALSVFGAQLRAEGVRRAEARQATTDPVGQEVGHVPDPPAVTSNMARSKRQTPDIVDLDRLLADTPQAHAALTVFGAQLRAEGLRRTEARQATIDLVGQDMDRVPDAPAVTPNTVRPKRRTPDIADLDRLLADTPQATVALTVFGAQLRAEGLRRTEVRKGAMEPVTDAKDPAQAVRDVVAASVAPTLLSDVEAAPVPALDPESVPHQADRTFPADRPALLSEPSRVDEPDRHAVEAPAEPGDVALPTAWPGEAAATATPVRGDAVRQKAPTSSTPPSTRDLFLQLREARGWGTPAALPPRGLQPGASGPAPRLEAVVPVIVFGDHAAAAPPTTAPNAQPTFSSPPRLDPPAIGAVPSPSAARATADRSDPASRSTLSGSDPRPVQAGMTPSPAPTSGSPRPVPSSETTVPARPATGPAVPLASLPARAVAAGGRGDAPAAAAPTESVARLPPQIPPAPPRAVDPVMATARSAPEPADIELDDIEVLDDSEDVVVWYNSLAISSGPADASGVGATAQPSQSDAGARPPAVTAQVASAGAASTERPATRAVGAPSPDDAVQMPMAVSLPASPVPSPPATAARKPGLLSRTWEWFNGGPADPEPEPVNVVPPAPAVALTVGQRTDATSVEDADADERAVERAQPRKAAPPPETSAPTASLSRVPSGPWTPAAIAAGDRPLFGLLAFYLTTNGEDPRYAERIRSMVEVLGLDGNRFAAHVRARIANTRGTDAEIVARAKSRLAQLSSWADALKSPITKRLDSDLIQVEVRRIGGPTARLAPIAPKLPGDDGGGVGGGVAARSRKRPETGPER